MLSIRTTVQTIVGAGAWPCWVWLARLKAQSPHWAPASQGSYVTAQFNAPPAPRYEAVCPGNLRLVASVTGNRAATAMYGVATGSSRAPAMCTVNPPGSITQPLGLPRQPLGS